MIVEENKKMSIVYGSTGIYDKTQKFLLLDRYTLEKTLVYAIIGFSPLLLTLIYGLGYQPKLEDVTLPSLLLFGAANIWAYWKLAQKNEQTIVKIWAGVEVIILILLTLFTVFSIVTEQENIYAFSSQIREFFFEYVLPVIFGLLFLRAKCKKTRVYGAIYLLTFIGSFLLSPTPELLNLIWHLMTFLLL
jgi:hypothetical protein